MPVYLLDDDLWFPPLSGAMPDGLLAAGGDLSADRLLLAYQNGIFPWFSEEDEMPLWWSPDPRFVLFPAELEVSKSMQKVLRSGEFTFTYNTAFPEVIARCSSIARKDQPGTWITRDIIAAYTTLHQMGYAFSAEAWHNGTLVGGLYGVWLGNIFFGESMFSERSNASKFAFISWVQLLQQSGVTLVDCQVHTPHLESLGARMIPRAQFIDILDTALR